MTKAIMSLLILSALSVPTGAEERRTLPLGHPDFRPSPAHPVGFRGDWTGRYPGATPPIELSFAHNVLWKTAVGKGESSPIVVGNRLFLLSDGVRVQCLDKMTGAVLWEREHHAHKDVPDEAIAWKLEEYVILHHRARPLLDRAKRLAKQRKDLEKSDAVTTKAAEVAALQQQEDDAKRSAAVFQEQQHGLDPLALGARGAITYAIATPCSDGRFVYVYLPMGSVVCYDLDGNRQWYRLLGGAKRTGGGWQGGQIGPSPLLVNGMLIIHYDQYYGLDAATGKTVWVTKTKQGNAISSPVPGRRGDTWFAMMGTGQALRVADGALVFDPPWATSINIYSPIFYDDMFCWVGAAVRLPETPEGMASLAWELTTEDKGKGRIPGRTLGWHGYASPLYHDGRVFYLHEKSCLLAFHARTGKLVKTMDAFPVSGEVYPSIIACGDLFFLSNRWGNMMLGRLDASGIMRIESSNSFNVELGGNMPVFDGHRFYLRVSPAQRDKNRDAPTPNFGPDTGAYLMCFKDPLAGPPPMDAAGLSDPAMLAQLDLPDSVAAFDALRLLAERAATHAALGPDLARRLEDANPYRVLLALYALRALGASARDAAAKVLPFLYDESATSIPCKTTFVTHRDLARAAQGTLVAMGSDIVPLLTDALTTGKTGAKNQEAGVPALCRVLAHFGPEAKTAVPALAGWLSSGSRQVCEAVLESLRGIDPMFLKEQGVPALMQRIQDARTSPRDKEMCLVQLGSLGADAGAAKSVIEAATQDADAAVARAARKVLMIIQPGIVTP